MSERKRKRLLFVGDAGCPTGFGNVNEQILSGLDPEYWEKPFVLGINYNGDPHPLGEKVRLYPADPRNTNPFGVDRIADVVASIKPDVLFIHQDAWIIVQLVEAIRHRQVAQPPTVAWIPPDSVNQPSASLLNSRVQYLLTPTQFGLDTMYASGYSGPGAVVPYGVDLDLFQHIDRTAARAAFGYPAPVEDAFVFGRADRNAIRKRYDITVEAFGRWWNDTGKPNAYLHCHCATRDVGYDLPQLCKYYGLGTEEHPRVFFTSKEMKPVIGLMLPRSRMPLVYNGWHAHLSTAMGEGFGLVALESAACGRAQIVPDSSAYGEWLRDAARLIPTSANFTHTAGVNTIGRVVSVDDTIEAMDELFRDPVLLRHYDVQARERARMFPWSRAIAGVESALRKVVEE